MFDFHPRKNKKQKNKLEAIYCHSGVFICLNPSLLLVISFIGCRCFWLEGNKSFPSSSFLFFFYHPTLFFKNNSVYSDYIAYIKIAAELISYLYNTVVP